MFPVEFQEIALKLCVRFNPFVPSLLLCVMASRVRHFSDLTTEITVPILVRLSHSRADLSLSSLSCTILIRV